MSFEFPALAALAGQFQNRNRILFFGERAIRHTTVRLFFACSLQASERKFRARVLPSRARRSSPAATPSAKRRKLALRPRAGSAPR